MPATQAVGGVFHTNAQACGACALPRLAAELAVSGCGAPSLSPSVGVRGRRRLSPTPAGTAATHRFPSEDPAEIAATGPQWRLGDREHQSPGRVKVAGSQSAGAGRALPGPQSTAPSCPGRRAPPQQPSPVTRPPRTPPGLGGSPPTPHPPPGTGLILTSGTLSGYSGSAALFLLSFPADSPLYQKNVLRGSSTAPDTSRFPLCHGRVAPLATRGRRLRFPQPRSARARVLPGAASGGRAAGPGGPAHWRSVSVPRHLRADRLCACGRRGQPGQCPGHVPAEPAFPADPAHAPDGPQGRHLEAPGLRHLRAQQSRCCGRATRARGGPQGRAGGHEGARATRPPPFARSHVVSPEGGRSATADDGREGHTRCAAVSRDR